MNSIVHFLPGLEEISSRKTAREKGLLVAEAFARSQLFGTPLPGPEQLEHILASLGPRQAEAYNRIIELEYWLRILIGHELQGKVQAFEASVERLSLQVKYLRLQENMLTFLEQLARDYPLMRAALQRFAGENLPDIPWGSNLPPEALNQFDHAQSIVARYREIRTLAAAGLDAMREEEAEIAPYRERLTEWKNLRLPDIYRRMSGADADALDNSLYTSTREQWRNLQGR